MSSNVDKTIQDFLKALENVTVDANGNIKGISDKLNFTIEDTNENADKVITTLEKELEDLQARNS